MKTVGVAALKARLSEHLREVQQGEIVTVVDRKTPVARLVPYERELPTGLKVRMPLPGSLRPGQVPLPAPVDLPFDVVELLLEDRRNGR